MPGVLERVREPADLKKLSSADLEELVREIRELIIRVVMKNGGHLAASLGAVELTVALHLAFDSPKDKIIWDVGHQSYAHKILTGRADRFQTLRRFGGLSGYPSPSESSHDHFCAGHASTSISLAVGLATARDALGESYHVVAVIGDGGLTGGMAFEALNNLGHSRRRAIVVINDNTMSIAPSVGALSLQFSRLRAHPAYGRVKTDLDEIIRRIPVFGDDVARQVEKLKRGVKQLVVPGMFFEELGFTYLGPVPGHDIRAMERYFNAAKRMPGPVAVHVLTQKGKGYAPAEKEPERFHGVSRKREGNEYEIYPAGGTPKRQTYSEVFGSTMVRIAAKDKRIVALTAAMGSGTGLSEFQRLYPERFIDVGIAEQHAICAAVGMWKGGLTPVVAIYSTFLQRGYDQVMHDICLNGAGVVLAIDRAGIVGEDGATHHGVFDLAYLRHLPGIVIMAPRDGTDLERMLEFAISLKKPAAVRYPRSAVPEEISPRSGRAPLEEMCAELVYTSSMPGPSVGIVALGSMVEPCVLAAMELEGDGISCDVLDLRFAKPLDVESAIRLATKGGARRPLVVVEEHALACGVGSALLEGLAERGVWLEVHRIGLPDEFIPHGSREELLSEYGLDVRGIEAKIRAILGNEVRATAGTRQLREAKR